jgi:hypothetical protein
MIYIGSGEGAIKKKQLDGVIKFSIQAVPTGLGFATRNYLDAQ